MELDVVAPAGARMSIVNTSPLRCGATRRDMLLRLSTPGNAGRPERSSQVPAAPWLQTTVAASISMPRHLTEQPSPETGTFPSYRGSRRGFILLHMIERT